MRFSISIGRLVSLATIGALAGAAAGLATISAATRAAPYDATRAVFDVVHSPPLLTLPGERPKLTFEAHCAQAGVEDPEAGCEVDGVLHVREAGAGAYSAVPLTRGSANAGPFEASLPDDLWEAPALEYYAVFRANGHEEPTTVPPGGASAPATSRRLDSPVSVALARHRFGVGGRVGERAAFARWGDGPADAGLDPTTGAVPAGASSFDVDASGSIVLLDHVHRRLLRWRAGARVPDRIPLSINGTIADLASDHDGSLYVLETTSRGGRTPLIRRFDDAGRELEAVEAAERSPAQIRLGHDGPVVLQRPSHQWMPATVGGVPASPAVQRSHGRMGRPVRSGGEIIVVRPANELRVATLARGRLTRAWRVTSPSTLGEVQLAEPLGSGLVVVVRLYDDDSDEFAVLVLDRQGLVSRQSLASEDWAEAAPLGRFRLVGRNLYRLGSSPMGVFIDRFELEVR